VGPFRADPPVATITFHQGVAGYNGAQDTQVWAETPAANNSATDLLTADLDTGAASGDQQGQVLVRFGSLFGEGAGQVPTNSIIHSAKLIMFTPLSPTGADYDSDDTFRLHRMIADWNDASTWNSLAGGVSADGVEAASSFSFSLVPEVEEVDGAPAIFDVTSDVELFRTGVANRGWCIRPSTSGTGNGWSMSSSETAILAQRPALEITYSTAANGYLAWAASQNLDDTNNSPTADPDQDQATNLMEFAYNMNPLVPDARAVTTSTTSGLPAARYQVISGAFQAHFLRRKGPLAAGLTYTAQFSSDPSGPWVNGLVPSVVPINADWDRIMVRDSVPGPTPRRFARVAVTLQP
jgi:hypothetical protein